MLFHVRNSSRSLVAVADLQMKIAARCTSSCSLQKQPSHAFRWPPIKFKQNKSPIHVSVYRHRCIWSHVRAIAWCSLREPGIDVILRTQLTSCREEKPLHRTGPTSGETSYSVKRIEATLVGSRRAANRGHLLRMHVQRVASTRTRCGNSMRAKFR
jgi:hypothetical protein